MSIQDPTMSEQGSISSLAGVAFNDRTPLLSQNRLFRSLSGAGGIRPLDGTSARSLTTFSGVFTPVCLSMFSALLFLRIGYIVGQAGVFEVLAQLLLAYIILVCTVLSISAISTNGAVEGGGVYYMISRTLGPEFGGSIGTLFFFANIFSSALYITGCVEGLVDNFSGDGGYLVKNGIPSGTWWSFLYATLVGLFNLVVCLIGASMFARTSLVIFIVVMICALSVIISIFAQNKVIEVELPDANHLVNRSVITHANYTGLSSETFHSNLFSHYSEDYTTNGVVNFATVFGVLFSGVTGIMAGANMSGDLRDPSRSIPKGTLWAVGFTGVIYLILTLLTAGSCTNFLLHNNYIFMQNINLWPPFVVVGIFAATLSAALSNLIGASRVLEAVAKDNLFGIVLRPVARLVFKGNPILAVFISWILVQAILLIGSLNKIAQMTSVLFLLSYCATNIACLALEVASAPNFRPSFKYFSWHTCILGFVGCLSMMFVINAIYAAVCIILCLVLIIALHLRSPASNWGSISQALIFHQVRKYLLLLDSRKDHVKFWRPQMLLMVSNPRSCCPLIQFANDLKKSGLYVLGHVKVGTSDTHEADPLLDEYPYWLSLIDYLKVKAFVELTMAPTVCEGMHHLVRISGLGAMKPNTILFGFYDNSPQEDFFKNGNTPFLSTTPNVELGDLPHPFTQIREGGADKPLSGVEYVKMIKDTVWMQKNVCICRHFQKLDKNAIMKNSQPMYIDVWPMNFFQPDKYTLYDTTTLFLLQLACILHMVPGWKSKTMMRVFLCASALSQDTENRKKQLDQLLQLLRIDSIITIVVWDHVFSLHSSQKEETKEEKKQTEVDVNQINNEYIQAVNELLKQHSKNTAVSFLYLSPPPSNSYQFEPFLRLLDIMTSDLPPTVLVHGISPVTTTTL